MVTICHENKSNAIHDMSALLRTIILNALNCSSSSHILDESCIFLARTTMFKTKRFIGGTILDQTNTYLLTVLQIARVSFPNNWG